MHSSHHLFTCICAGVLIAGLVGIAANAAPVLPRQSAMTDFDTLIKVRGGPACCKTTMRCVRKVGAQCSEWRLVVTSICPGVICR